MAVRAGRPLPRCLRGRRRAAPRWRRQFAGRWRTCAVHQVLRREGHQHVHRRHPRPLQPPARAGAAPFGTPISGRSTTARGATSRAATTTDLQVHANTENLLRAGVGRRQRPGLRRRHGTASKPAVADGRPGLAPNAPSRQHPHLLCLGRTRSSVSACAPSWTRCRPRPYLVHWDARDGRGAAVAAGVIRQHPGGVQTRRMLYLK